ncbi:IclR family transcriptional regulator [Streptomyces sp. NPDC101225]|uniref:IclR family transcriptional regulator n=1 Tax=Streptomyces sp. NPDC101225 TaxID=3366135 RepID=UPI0037F3EA10
MERDSILGRGMNVLAAVGELAPTTVEALAARVGLPTSTAYRYVRTLRELGYIQEYEGYYDIGVRMLGLVWDARAREALARLASPLLFELVSRTSETATLVVREGHLARTAMSVEPHRPVRLSFQTGTTHPLHSGAPAKMLLACMPEAFRLDYVSRTPLDTLPQHRFHAQALSEQLVHIREANVCITRGEVDVDSVGVSVPVFRHGELIAALSVAGPASRLGDRQMREVEQLLRSAARQLEGLLDCRIAADRASPRADDPPRAGTRTPRPEEGSWRAAAPSGPGTGHEVLRARRTS